MSTKTPRTDALTATKDVGALKSLLGNDALHEQFCAVAELARILETELAAKESHIAELERDAGRYRWLRKNMTYTNGETHIATNRTAPILTIKKRTWYHECSDFDNNTLDAHCDAAAQQSAAKLIEEGGNDG